MTYRQLELNIQQHSCACGNRWTHSYATYVNGGTPTLQDISPLFVGSISVGPERRTNVCFACAPGHIKPNIWRPKAVSPAAEGRATKKAADINDLLK